MRVFVLEARADQSRTHTRSLVFPALAALVVCVFQRVALEDECVCVCVSES